MEQHPRIKRVPPIWTGEPCFVVATGPSLTREVAHKVRMARWVDQWRVIVVNDAYTVLPYADVVYACDNAWWQKHQRCEGFHGERWGSHQFDKSASQKYGNDKRALADQFDINLVLGEPGDEFSFNAGLIRYGSNSGFQAINLALLFGCRNIVLVGFDLRHVAGKSHFFGDHVGLTTIPDHGLRGFARHFETAARVMPKDVSIVNATPGSALTCFPMMSLEQAIACRAEVPRPDAVPDRNGTVSHAGAG